MQQEEDKAILYKGNIDFAKALLGIIPEIL